MGPYNPLDQQLEYNKDTGEVTKWHVKPKNKVDKIAAHHDICYDMGKSKGDCDKEMVKSIDQIPWKDKPWGATAVRNIINTKQKLGLGLKVKKRKTALSNDDDWTQQLADELHKPIRRNFKKRRVIVNHIDDIWCSDLVEMQQFSRWNKGYRYLLMVLDVFSKYGWILPLKDKKGETVMNAFKTIFKKSGRIPKYLWVDNGKEYYNQHVKALLEKHNIKMYSTENEEKSSVCERWNRTIKTRMWKQFTVQSNTQYLDILPKILKQYNNTKHSSIKMTPVEASKKKNEDLFI